MLLRTPGGGGSALRPNLSRRTIATTPHAIRALAQRRGAGATPGRDRRRSGRGVGRETPRDILRMLSTKLAPRSEMIEPSPEVHSLKRRSRVPDEEDDGPDPKIPRLSMNLLDDDDDEYDTFLATAPRLSLPPEDDHTMRSVELPRRAMSEQPRLSFGNMSGLRVSDAFKDATMLSLGAESVGNETTELGFGDEYADIDDYVANGLDDTVPGSVEGYGLDDTEQLSDVEPADLPVDDGTSFIFRLPNRQEQREATSPEISEGESEDDQQPDVELDDDEEVEENNDDDEGPTMEEQSDDDLPAPFDDDDEPMAGLDLDEEIEAESNIGLRSPEPSLLDDETARDITIQRVRTAKPVATAKDSRAPRKKKALKVSRHGIPYPSLPSSIVRQLVTAVSRTRGSGKSAISKDTLTTIMQATDLFFEQVSEDLGAYATHAGKKTIDESDVIALMKRYGGPVEAIVIC
jgi:histone H3/H4